MTQMVYDAYGRAFSVRTRSPTQLYSFKRDCQRECRRQWTKVTPNAGPAYLLADPAGGPKWPATRHPEYWRSYRQRRPAAVLSRPVQSTVAASDASIAEPIQRLAYAEWRSIPMSPTEAPWSAGMSRL